MLSALGTFSVFQLFTEQTQIKSIGPSTDLCRYKGPDTSSFVAHLSHHEHSDNDGRIIGIQQYGESPLVTRLKSVLNDLAQLGALYLASG